MHTHSIASGHGTASTIAQMAKYAAFQGMKLLGITDHGPATLGAGTPSYFRSLSCSPRHRCGINVFYGAELNILDTDGRLDLSDDLICGLDYVIISMHRQTYTGGSRDENTRALRRAMKHPGVKILGHCDDPHYPVDYEELTRCAKECGVIFEINEASLAPYSYRGDTKANDLEILHCCEKYDLPLVLSSDSHGLTRIGDFSCASEFIHNASFPEQLILNNQIPKLKSFLHWREA